MRRLIPAHAGFFRVTIRVPNDEDWCHEMHAAFDEWMGRLAESDSATALAALPSVRVGSVSGDLAELILEWVHQPADGPWPAVEEAVDTVRSMSPDLLLKTDDLHVSVVRESAVGHDVVFDDERLAALDREVEQRLQRGRRPSDFDG